MALKKGDKVLTKLKKGATQQRHTNKRNIAYATVISGDGATYLVEHKADKSTARYYGFELQVVEQLDKHIGLSDSDQDTAPNRL